MREAVSQTHRFRSSATGGKKERYAHHHLVVQTRSAGDRNWVLPSSPELQAILLRFSIVRLSVRRSSGGRQSQRLGLADSRGNKKSEERPTRVCTHTSLKVIIAPAATEWKMVLIQSLGSRWVRTPKLAFLRSPKIGIVFGRRPRPARASSAFMQKQP